MKDATYYLRVLINLAHAATLAVKAVRDQSNLLCQEPSLYQRVRHNLLAEAGQSLVLTPVEVIVSRMGKLFSVFVTPTLKRLDPDWMHEMRQIYGALVTHLQGEYAKVHACHRGAKQNRHLEPYPTAYHCSSQARVLLADCLARAVEVTARYLTVQINAGGRQVSQEEVTHCLRVLVGMTDAMVLAAQEVNAQFYPLLDDAEKSAEAMAEIDHVGGYMFQPHIMANIVMEPYQLFAAGHTVGLWGPWLDDDFVYSVRELFIAMAVHIHGAHNRAYLVYCAAADNRHLDRVEAVRQGKQEVDGAVDNHLGLLLQMVNSRLVNGA